MILDKMESSLEPEILNQASNEIRHQYLSAQRARNELDWRPLFTLEEGLSRAIAWYRTFLEINDELTVHRDVQIPARIPITS